MVIIKIKGEERKLEAGELWLVEDKGSLIIGKMNLPIYSYNSRTSCYYSHGEQYEKPSDLRRKSDCLSISLNPAAVIRKLDRSHRIKMSDTIDYLITHIEQLKQKSYLGLGYLQCERYCDPYHAAGAYIFNFEVKPEEINKSRIFVGRE